MKGILVGIVLALLTSTVNHYVWENTEKGAVHRFATFLEYKVFQGGYILDPLAGRCKDEMAENGFGWKFNVADYYGCDKFQRLLNGNHKPADPNSVRY